MAKPDTVYSLFGMKTPQQVMDEEFARQFKYMQGQRSGYQQAGAGIGLLLGNLFGGKSAELQQAEDREQAYAQTTQELAAKERQARTQNAEAFVQDLTPENIGVALRTEQRLQSADSPFNKEIDILNKKADEYDLLASKFSSLGQPAEYVEGLKNQALSTRMQALTKKREAQTFEQDQAKYALDMEKTREELIKLQNRDKFTPKELVELQLKSTPESYQKWLQGKGVLEPNFAAKNVPADIQEYEYFNSLPNDEARARYLQVTSASNWRDLGDRFSLIVDGREIQSIRKSLAPGEQPKTIAEQEEAKTVGQAVGKDKMAVPGQLGQLEQYETAILDLANHKGFSNIFGFGGSRLAQIEGSQAFGAAATLEKVQGNAFLGAIPQMKGMGSLTEAEGRAITAASNKLKLGLPEAEAKKEIDLILSIINIQKDRLKNKQFLTPEQVMTMPLTIQQERTTSGGVRYRVIGG
jgi:hypothetical protein